MKYAIIEQDKMALPFEDDAQIQIAEFDDKEAAEKALAQYQKNANPEFDSYFIKEIS
jgi:hypothetical protein